MRTKEEISLAAGTTSVNEHRTFLGKWGPSFCTFSQVQRWIPATIVSQNQELCRCCCHALFLRAKIHCFDQKHQKQFSCSKVNISVQRHILFISFHCNPSRSMGRMSRMSRMRLKWRCLLADIKSRFRSLQVPDPSKHCQTLRNSQAASRPWEDGTYRLDVKKRAEPSGAEVGWGDRGCPAEWLERQKNGIWIDQIGW
jgi:hypothetical protein